MLRIDFIQRLYDDLIPETIIDHAPDGPFSRDFMMISYLEQD